MEKLFSYNMVESFFECRQIGQIRYTQHRFKTNLSRLDFKIMKERIRQIVGEMKLTILSSLVQPEIPEEYGEIHEAVQNELGQNTEMSN